MSNIYIQEPPSDGKVCLETTAGDIDVELWSREAPKACRNFVQLCMEGYYDGTIFHRLVKGFIVQGGDPTGTGAGGNSIWGKPFKDEFHSRLRFVRRGLVAMANAGRDDNGSQFFFTLGATPELQNKHTIFGKIGGNTIYNMLKLEDGVTDEDEKPMYPHKIVKTKVLNNPFSDIVPRETIRKSKTDKEKNKSNAAATKNYKLLSFGEEAEEDEEEVDEVNKKFSGRGKSSHDLANDPKLSSQPAVDVESPLKSVSKKDSDNSSSTDEDDGKVERDRNRDEEERSKKNVENIREKLKGKKDSKTQKPSSKSESNSKKDEEDSKYTLGQDERLEQKRKLEQLQKEYKELKRSMRKEEQAKQNEEAISTKEANEKTAKLAAENNVIKDFLDEQQKYKAAKQKNPKKGEDRESLTLAMLAKFKSKIETAKETFGDRAPTGSSKLKDLEEGEEDEKPDDISWLAQKLQNDSKDEVLAKDANTKSDDWFDIYDPRNALTKRRREKSQQDSKERKRAKINN